MDYHDRNCDIRVAYAKGVKQVDLAKQYKVSRQRIWQIVRLPYKPKHPKPKKYLEYLEEQKTIRVSDIRSGSIIECKCSDGSNYITFNHLDGMFSHCVTENGNIVHPSGMQPLLLLPNGHYKLTTVE